MASKLQAIEVGTRYNKLRFVRDLGMREAHRYGLWVCDCGNEVEVQVSAVRKGRTKSCGCLGRVTRAKKVTAREGDRFGELIFIKTAGYNGHLRIGLFKCDCGIECEKPVVNVVHGNTKSCGHVLENIGIRQKAKKKYIEERNEEMFSWKDYKDSVI